MEVNHCSTAPAIKQEYFENIKMEDQEYEKKFNIVDNIKPENDDGFNLELLKLIKKHSSGFNYDDELMKLVEEFSNDVQAVVKHQAFKGSDDQVSKLKAEIEAKDRSVKKLQEKVKQLEKEKVALKKDLNLYKNKKDAKNFQKKYDSKIADRKILTFTSRRRDDLFTLAAPVSQMPGQGLTNISGNISFGQCPWCRFRTFFEGSYNSHIRMHHKHCEICDFSFDSIESLGEHMSKKHDKPLGFFQNFD